MRKVLLSTLLLAGLAQADRYVKYEMIQDANYSQQLKKALETLEAKGYKVIKIEADDFGGKPAFEVDAIKDKQKFELKLAYPDLEILVEQPDH